MVFGREKEASDEEPESRGSIARDSAAALRSTASSGSPPTWRGTRQGNIFISDGYINSRVAKCDKNGDWVKSFGEPGNKPGQLNTPHSIAADARREMCTSRTAATAGSQVFDTGW